MHDIAIGQFSKTIENIPYNRYDLLLRKPPMSFQMAGQVPSITKLSDNVAVIDSHIDILAANNVRMSELLYYGYFGT